MTHTPPDDEILRKIKESVSSIPGLRVASPEETKAILALMSKKAQALKTRRTPRYHYESKYQFPEDINIVSADPDEEMDPEGFRNAMHLSVSRGMEFMEMENLKDYLTVDEDGEEYVARNVHVDKLDKHINDCIKKELGPTWGHSGSSAGFAISQVLLAKEHGWDVYIQKWVEKTKQRREQMKREKESKARGDLKE